LCAFCGVPDPLSEHCLRRRAGVLLLFTAVFRTNRRLHERYVATCLRRRRHGHAQRRQGGLQITAVLGGRPLDVDRDIGHPYLGNLSPGGSVDRRLVTAGGTQNRVCVKPGMLRWSKAWGVGAHNLSALREVETLTNGT